jgi:polyisoprenoid-binding protein YceI
MAPSGQLTSSAVQASLAGGEFAGCWTLDPARSEVHLKTRHTWGLRPLNGVFREVSGNGTVTVAGDVTGFVSVAAESVDTKNKQRDKHLRSADFFDIANHSHFVFAVDGITPAGGGVHVTGSLTVRDRTQPVSFDATVSSGEGEVVLDGEIPVNRGDFGLTWNWLGIASMQSTIVVHAVFTRD